MNPNKSKDKLSEKTKQNGFGTNQAVSVTKNKTSNLLDGEINLDVLGDRKVKTRVYLLRHFPYIEDPENNDYKNYKKLLNKKIKRTISKEEIEVLRDLSSKVEIYKSIEELPIKQQNIYSNVFNGNKTFVYYNKNGSTKESSRTSITAENLIEYFGVTNFENSSLKETDKANNAGYNFGEVSKAFTEFYHGTALDLIKSGIYDNVVIVGNRSYANAFQVIGGGIINKSILDSVEQIQDDDYIYLDYNSNGEIIESRKSIINNPS